MPISNWDSNEANNDSAPPAGAPEGATLISDLNNIDRTIMADVRAWYENPEYRDLGHTLETSASVDSVILQGDVQSAYAVGQSVQLTDADITPKTARISLDGRFIMVYEFTLDIVVNPQATALLSGPDFTAYETPFVDKVAGTDGNLVNFDANGDMVDSGIGVDAAPTDASTNVVDSNGIFDAIVAAQAAATEINDIDRASQGHIVFNAGAGLGVMIQWGRTGSTSVSFNPNFSSTPYSIVIGQEGSDNNLGGSALIKGISSGGFNVSGVGSSLTSMSWVAIGPVTI